jgi:hypothetical protein
MWIGADAAQAAGRNPYMRVVTALTWYRCW